MLFTSYHVDKTTVDIWCYFVDILKYIMYLISQQIMYYVKYYMWFYHAITRVSYHTISVTINPSPSEHCQNEFQPC